MKITVKDIGRREYYDEVLYAASNYKKFQKNPNKKIKGFIKAMLMPTIAYIVLVLLMLVLFWQDRDNVFLLLAGMLIFVVVFFVIYLVKGNKQINAMMADKGTRYIEITEDSVKFEDSKKVIEQKWTNIMNVLLGPHSIIFLPTGTDGALITIDRTYEEEVLRAVNEAGYGNLLVERK
ncbi:MAG: hypothetical protein IJT40_03190 [Firmicutes bacterium]|nr:hypothetical protein [Bacillota bacterium]